MFVADIVKTILFEHRRQIILLDHPRTVRSENPRNIGYKTIRVVKVVEHCNARDDVRLPFSKLPFKDLSAEEIIEDQVGPFGCFWDKILGGLEPNQVKTIGSIRSQESAIVATNIQN